MGVASTIGNEVRRLRPLAFVSTEKTDDMMNHSGAVGELQKLAPIDPQESWLSLSDLHRHRARGFDLHFLGVHR